MSKMAHARKIHPQYGPHVQRALASHMRDAARSISLQQSHLVGTAAVDRLEAKLRCYLGVRHALAVSSATLGLYAVARALQLDGADVISSPLGWGGMVGGLLEARAQPVFADVERRTLGLDPSAVHGALTTRTRAILGIDFLGVPADSLGLRRIADANGLWYIHDGAQSLGALREGKRAGQHAHVTILSFGFGKTLSVGEGGAILMNDDDLYERLVWLTQHPYRHRREIGLSLSNELALNGRIHPLAAVWADADFEPALARLEHRQRHGMRFAQRLDATDLTERTTFAELRIIPAFGSVSVAMRRGVRLQELRERLSSRDMRADVQPLRANLLHHNSAFHRSASPDKYPCPVAERQSRIRVEIYPRTHSFR